MKKIFVKLEQTDVKAPVPVPHELQHANALLKMPNCAWVLADEKFEWNGREITKKLKK